MDTRVLGIAGWFVPLGVCMAIATAASAQDTRLALKFAEGTRRFQTTETLTQKLNIAGTDVRTGVRSSVTVRSEIGKRGPDGAVKVKQTIESLTAGLDLPGDVKLEFDSAKPDATKADNPQLQPVVDAWKALSGVSYTVVLDRDNQVRSIEGGDAIPEPVKAQFSVDRMKKTAAQDWGFLPAQPVKKGDRWMRMEEKDLGSGQKLVYETYYEYQGPVEKEGRTLDKLGVFINTARLVIEENAALPATVKKSELKVESSAGTILIDRERGETVERTSSTRIIGPLTLEVMGMELAANLDLTLESVNTLRK